MSPQAPLQASEPASARRNIVALTMAAALGSASPPILISLGGLVGQRLASDPAMATLPVSLFNLGLALGTLPAAYLMRRYGRRSAYVFGACFGIVSGLIAAFGVISAVFAVFCAGATLAGFYAAYVQSYRFAAADGVEGPMKAKAISWVMLGGLAAAIIGPQLVIHTRDSIPDAPFAGAFFSQAALALLAIPVLLMLRTPKPAAMGAGAAEGGRGLGELLSSPRYLLAVATGIVSYGLMTFVMTAAPMAMVGHGHSVDHAAQGIQWHVLAMFAPSFVTGRLIARFGAERVAAVGLVVTALSGAVALGGMDLGHFWVSLILLGVGWNFGFIGASAMVAAAHSPAERGKAQGLNDFLVFGVVAAASFFSGALLNASGWRMINWLIFPAVALILAPLVWRTARRPQAQA